MVDIPVLLVREERAIETVKLGGFTLGGRQVLFRDWLLVEIWSVRREK